VDPLGDARDALIDAAQKAHRLAKSVEALEAHYARVENPDPYDFYVSTTTRTGLELDAGWNDDAPQHEHRTRRKAIDATLALRAAIHSAIEAVSGITQYMDSEAQSVDQRWTTRTIHHLRRLLGAIERGHGRDVFPSALPMIRAGVPDALREHAGHVWDHLEDVKSAIAAGVKPRTPAVVVSPHVPDRLERAAAPAAERIERDEGGDDALVVRLPKLQPHDMQAWQLSQLHGMTQDKVAEALSKEHGRIYTQGQVSRMIARARAHAQASGLAEKVAGRIDRPRMVDPGRLELGARVDRRAPRPSDLARADDDED
jgi:hypothetical protein